MANTANTDIFDNWSQALDNLQFTVDHKYIGDYLCNAEKEKIAITETILNFTHEVHDILDSMGLPKIIVNIDQFPEPSVVFLPKVGTSIVVKMPQLGISSTSNFVPEHKLIKKAKKTKAKKTKPVKPVINELPPLAYTCDFTRPAPVKDIIMVRVHKENSFHIMCGNWVACKSKNKKNKDLKITEELSAQDVATVMMYWKEEICPKCWKIYNTVEKISEAIVSSLSQNLSN